MLKFIEINKDKTPKTSFDKTYQDFDNLESAGVLLNEKVVVVDFDGDNEKENTIIDYILQHYPTLTIKTTRGIHFYYSKPSDIVIKNGADKITVGGFQVDYKTGARSYAIVKLNGKKRESNKKISLEDLPELPFILYPVYATNNKLSGMNDGDSRNDRLFHHLLNILNTYNRIDIIDIGNYINDNIFNESLKEKELNTLLNSVVKYAHSYNGDKKDLISFAKFLARELDIKLYNNMLYFNEKNKYISDKNKLLRKITTYLELKSTQDKEVIEQLYKYADYIENKHHAFKIKVRNGVIDKDKVTSSEYGFTPFYLDVLYNPSAYDETTDNFLNFICNSDKDMRLVIEEILGHCLMIDKFPHKMFFMIGKGSNGKSTFLEMITKWVGNLSSHIDIANFDDGTSIISLIDKIVNISDDIDPIYLEKSKNLKTMASGNTISARAIYSHPITLKNTATLIFTANEPPIFKDKSYGLTRRLMIIPFNNKVEKANYNLDEQLSTDNAKSYLLNLALQGINRIYDNGMKMTESEIIKIATEKYQHENDTVLSFIDYITDKFDIVGQEVGELYTMYNSYTNSTNQKPLSLNKFGRRLSDEGYVSTVVKRDGKSIRVYTQK